MGVAVFLTVIVMVLTAALGGRAAHASARVNPFVLIRSGQGQTARSAPVPVGTGQDPATASSVVANGLANSVTEYARSADGNAGPVATIAGPNTKLDKPFGVVLDPSGNLFVANIGSVTEYPTGASGDAAPIATIAGATTMLSQPAGVALDSSGTLFVTNFGDNTVTEYPKGATGDVAPIVTIKGLDTELNAPLLLVLNTAGQLFVANQGGNSVTEYAKGAHGDAAPVATIEGTQTQLSAPTGLALDSSGNLFVSNTSGTPAEDSVTEYPKGANGDVSPMTEIQGNNTGLDGPVGIDIDLEGNLLASNFFADSVTKYPQGGNGDVAPLATIQGNDTGLNGPSGIGVTSAPSVPQPVAASQQFGIPNQTDVFRVAPNGAVQVNWVQGAGKWNGPLAISPPNLAPPGAQLAVSNQFGIANQTDVFVVDSTGTLDVLWVDGAGKWNGPVPISKPGFAPGSALAASNQFGIPGQTDVFAVNQAGTLNVVWVEGNGAWQGPLAIGALPSGAGLAASNQSGIPGQTDVFGVDKAGTVNVFWVESNGKWQGPLAIGTPGAIPPGAALATSSQFGIPSQTDVFTVDKTGTANVLWVENAGKWQGPLAIGTPGLSTPGASLAASNQFGIPSQTDMFVADKTGMLQVVWVENAGKWNGPLAIGTPSLAPPGGPLAASNQFAIPSQTNVWAVDNGGTLHVVWVEGAGTWQGPLAI